MAWAGGYACFPAVCDGPLQGMLRIEPPKVHGVKPLLLPGLRNGAGCNPAELLRPLRAKKPISRPSLARPDTSAGVRPA